MATDRLDDGAPANRLGAFLRHRRQRLDPVAFGLAGRRRTPGLRREEVAQRACISATWYTWLEQGRGGAPSARVLDSLADALMMTDAEREHLFLVGIGRHPKAQPVSSTEISQRLQRLLDAIGPIPATVATATWDIVGWNFAARRVLADYETVPPQERNILRRMFLDPSTRSAQKDWDSVARFLVATFRAETVRAGQDRRAAAIVAELSALSEDFVRLWTENDVCFAGEGVKILMHPLVGEIALEFNALAVDGRPDLKLMIFNPASEADAEKVRGLCAADRRPSISPA